MKKKIVLKNLVSIVLAGFVLLFLSCDKDEKKIIGVWKYDKVDVIDFACSDPLTTSMLARFVPQILGAYLSTHDSEIEFTKNGDVIYRGTGNTAIYRVNDGRLIITGDDINTYDLSFPDKKTMQWEQDMDRYYLEMISEMIEDYAGYEIRITKCSYRETFKKQE